MSNEFMGGIYDGDTKRQEMASDATIRDYFAVAAMQSLPFSVSSNEQNMVAHAAYEMADAMLKARNQ